MNLEDLQVGKQASTIVLSPSPRISLHLNGLGGDIDRAPKFKEFLRSGDSFDPDVRD